MMKAAYVFLIIMMVIPVGIAFAQEGDVDEASIDLELEALLGEDEDVSLYEFPQIDPEYSAWFAQRHVNASGSNTVSSFEYLESSIILGAEMRAFNYPGRFYLMLEGKNENDHFADFRYAYRDYVFLRLVDRSVYHNIENISLRYLDDPATTPPGVSDSGEEYGVRSWMNDMFIRFKAPEFPAHAFLNVWHVQRDGTEQQRALLGSGWYNNLQRSTMKRDVEWDTLRYTVGVNSHLGPTEVEFLFRQKTFSAGDNAVLYYDFDGSAFRTPGSYQHNRIPEFEGTSETLKLHSSYTGKLVATATVTVESRENVTSRAKADYLLGSGALTWMPVTSLTVYLKYKHQESEKENPTTIAIADANNPANSYTFSVTQPVEESTDLVSIGGRYRPSRWLTTRATYCVENIKRDNAARVNYDGNDWGITDRTRKNTVKLSADARPSRNLDLRAQYIFRDIGDPAYNIDPDTSNGAVLSATWTPAAGASTLLSYDMTKEEREKLTYSSTVDAADREVLKQRLLGSGTLLLGKSITLNLSYAYMFHEIKQDLAYHAMDGSHINAPDTLYDDKAHIVSFGVGFEPTERLSLNSTISYTKSEGEFTTGNQDLLQPVSVASLVDFEIDKTDFRLDADYELAPEFFVDLEYNFVHLDDVLGNPDDDIEGGEVHTVMVGFSREW
jgi:hypothetical protein